MRTEQLTRAEFLAWIGQTVEDVGSSRHKTPSGDNSIVTLAWPSGDPADQPVIAVPASDMRSFVAYVMTYVGTYVPFTAFYRIVPTELLNSLPSVPRHKSIEELRPFIGAIIVDAAIQAGITSGKIQDVSLQACYATQSYTVAQSWNTGYESSIANAALMRWTHVRSLLGVPTTKLPPREIERFWSVALAALDDDAGVVGGSDLKLVSFVRGARLALERGLNAHEEFLTDLGISRSDLATIEQASREERVRALEAVFDKISKDLSSRASIEVALGYFIAQLSAGSLTYLPLALRYAQSYPLVPLWFGLFSGMRQDSDVLTVGDCIGRRILRKLQQSGMCLDTIVADLSYEEFLIYQIEGRVGRLRFERSSALQVELFPGIVTPFRSARANDVQTRVSTASSQTAADDAQWTRIRRLVTELSNLLPTEGQARVAEPRADLFTAQPATSASSKKRKVTSRKKPLS